MEIENGVTSKVIKQIAEKARGGLRHEEKSTKQEAEAARLRQDIRSLLRTRVREAIEITLEEELAEALGCGLYERSGERLGYRNGKQQRTITTAYGAKDPAWKIHEV